MDPIDSRFEALSLFLADHPSLKSTSVTESDTRLKTIDTILKNVLGWPLTSVHTEEQAGSGFIDYKLSVGGAARLIVEAKKDGISFELQKRQSGQAYKLNGAVFNADAKKAINQAITYSAFKNAELACVTNGTEWIVFRANRLGDGSDTLEGKAFVFTSLEEVKNNFTLFHDLLCEEGVRDLRFRGNFQEVEGIALRDLSFYKPLREPSSRRMLARGPMAVDLDSVMTSFFQRLKGEQDQEMILDCFVVTPESRNAEQKLSRVAEELVSRIREVNSGTGEQLVEVIQAVQKQQRNRFVLLVGNKGAGKSTFIERFFRFILPETVATGLTVIQVNVAHSEGDPQKIVSWLNVAVLTECEKVIFAEAEPTWDDYIGTMFFDEYRRWSEGTMRPLYETDKPRFKIEFGRYMEEIRAQQPHEYVKRLLRHIVHSRKKIPCLVFDNTDHFTIPFQESVFQYARSLYESELSLTVIPITDRTSWQLSKQGALQSFESEALFLPVPNPDRVIERRIAYLTEKIKTGKERQSNEYFFGRGIKLDISNLAAFAASLHKIFVQTRTTSDWLGGLVNYDIRRLLEQTRDVIASPHLPIEDLLKAHITSDALGVPEWRIKQAIIKRKYDIYPSGDHPYVQNIYAMGDTIIGDVVTTPLLGVRMLQYLRDAQAGTAIEDRLFVEVSTVYEHFSGMGINGRVVSGCLEKLLGSGLVQEYDPTITEIAEVKNLEISPAGKVHLIWGTSDPEYVKFMIDVTPVRDRNVNSELLGLIRDFSRNWHRCIATFVDYLLDEDSRYCQIPDHSLFQGQRNLVSRLVRVKDLALRSTNEYPARQSAGRATDVRNKTKGSRHYPKYIPRSQARDN